MYQLETKPRLRTSLSQTRASCVVHAVFAVVTRCGWQKMLAVTPCCLKEIKGIVRTLR
jgi:hypothetical protein